MKKFSKVCLIIALILFVLGAGIGVGTYLVVRETPWTDVSDSIGSHTYVFEGCDIKSVNVTTTYGNVEFEEGDVWTVEFSNVYTPMASASVDNNELNVSINTPVDISVCEWNVGVMPDFDIKARPKVKVIYPKNTELYSTDVQSSVGYIDFAGLKTDFLVAQTAIGQINAEDAYVYNSGATQTILGEIKTGDNFLIDTSYKFRLW